MRCETCNDVNIWSRLNIFWKRNTMFRLLGECIDLWCAMKKKTLLVSWNYINEEYQVLRVERGSYDYVWDVK